MITINIETTYFTDEYSRFKYVEQEVKRVYLWGMLIYTVTKNNYKNAGKT